MYESQPFLRKVPRKKEGGKTSEEDRWQPPPGTWDESLPYGGKVMLARRKKPMSEVAIAAQIVVGLCVFCLIYYSYYHLDDLIFRVHHVYALLGHSEAQHHVAQRYLQGIGVAKNKRKANSWLKAAADKGHPEASYNLAVAHLKGHHKLKPGQAHQLIKHAAKNGVREAYETLKGHCRKKGCQ